MDLSSIRKNVHFSKDSLVSLALVVLIIWGFVTKAFISMNLRLDSDSVGMGLMSMEIGKHNNYLLSGYHLLSSDSLVMTELVPFQLVPQILTNYNPFTLKFVIFFIFILSVMTLAYLIWFVSKNTLSPLIFAALAANIPPKGYFWLAYPTTHNATILFGAVILVILFSMSRSAENQRENNEKTGKKKNCETRIKSWQSWPYSLAAVTLVFLSVFSDTIILVWVLGPFILAYLLFYPRKTGLMNSVILYIIITSVTAYILKTYIMLDWIRTNYEINSIPEIFSVNIPLFVKAQLLFLNQGLSALAGGSTAVGPAEVISIVLFASVIFCCIKSVWYGWDSNTPEKKLLYIVLLISVLMMAGSFLVSGFAYDIEGARYLTFTSLILLMLVAVSCPVTEKTCTFLVILLLVVSAIAGSVYISTMTSNPNELEYELISYLKSQNQTYGYGTYWNSNIITYLSGETVTIRSTYFLPSNLRQNTRNSCDRWFFDRPDKAFLIYDTTRVTDEAQKNFPLLVKQGNTSEILHYQNYDIFLFNNT